MRRSDLEIGVMYAQELEFLFSGFVFLTSYI